MTVLHVTAFDLTEVPGCWGMLGLPAGPGWHVDQESKVQGSRGLAKEGALRSANQSTWTVVTTQSRCACAVGVTGSGVWRRWSIQRKILINSAGWEMEHRSQAQASGRRGRGGWTSVKPWLQRQLPSRWEPEDKTKTKPS